MYVMLPGPNNHPEPPYSSMSAADWYKRQKNKLRRALSHQERSVSLPNPSQAQPPTSPAPQLVVNLTDKGNASRPLSSDNTSAEASKMISGPQPVGISASTGSLPNLGVGALPSPTNDEMAAAISSPPFDDISKPEAQSKITWSGLNALLRVLKSGEGGIGPLQSAIEGLERCVGIFGRASNARADYQELGKKLDRLLGGLARFNNAWMGKAMTASVKNLCGGIEAELGMIEEKQGRAGPGRYIDAMGDSDAILECYRRIQGHVERLLLNANLNMWKIVDEEMTDRRLRQLCPTMSGAYDSWPSGRRKCTKGTRVPELEKLKNWVRNPSTESIYWINGTAGTGKTTIAYTLCAQLDATSELAASFFCTRLLPECRHVQRIIPAIAYQLAQFSYPFRYELSKALGSDLMTHTRELESQFQTLITSPLKRIRHTLPSRFIVVIDALDECEDRNNIGKILELLVASTSELPIRFLVSSRPEPEIYRCMMKQVGGNSNARLVLHELDPLEIQHDIEAYLRQELQDVPLTAHQWKELVERCSVLFIYASTACRYIKRGDEMMSYEEAVDTVLGLPLGETRDMEKELDKLYTVILETAFNKSQIGEANRKRMKMLLDSIICAQGPMRTEAWAVPLGLNNAEHVMMLLRPLLSVVNVTEETGIMTTLHASFPDFMLSPDRSAGFYCTATAHHLTLAHACLQQIKFNPVQFNICGIESSYLLDDEIKDLRERADRAVAPALLYACCHWIAHLELCGHTVDFLESVMDFLSTRLLLWMEVLNVTMQLYYGATGIIRLEEWCRKARMSKEAIELAHDASEFVQSYSYKPVQQSTAHIYTSMLPFWPSDSPIAKHYLPRTSEMPQPEGAAITRRRFLLLAARYMGEPMRAVCYYPNGHQIAAAVGNDIYILGEDTGRIVLGPLEGHTDLVTCVAISPNGLYIGSGSYDSTIRVWDAKSGELVAGPFKAHRDRVTSVAFSPDSARIVSTGASEGLQIWSVPGGEPITSTSPLVEPSLGIRTATFSADGLEIISGDCNNAICFWDAHTGDLISKQSRGHTGPVNSVALSTDGSQFVSASADGTICVWDTKGRQMVLGPLNGHLGEVNQAAFSPNDMYIASCAEDGTIRLWDAGSGQMITLTQRFSGSINSFAFSPDNSRLVSCTGNESVCIWAIKHPGVDDGMLMDIGVIRSASLSSDGSQIAIGTQNGSLWIWDTLSGELVTGPLTGHEGYICSVAISSDGAYIASASSDKTIRLWGVKATKGAYKVLEHHTKRADTLKFTSDNLQLFYGSVSYPIGASPFTSKGIEASNSNRRDEWAGDISNFVGCCITSSPDGSYAASGSVGGTLRVWHTQTGRLIISPLQAPPNGAFASLILFSPDGKYLVSCCAGNIVSFWPIPSRPNHKLLDYHSADTSKRAGDSTNVTLRWKLTDSGWIVNHRNEHLIWVPDDLRPYLLRSGNERLISHRGSFKLDFTGANIGELWTRSYRPVQ